MLNNITHALWVSGYGYIDPDEPYEIPETPVPEGWTSLSIPWLGEEKVLVLWQDGDELFFHGTHENYISRTKYCLKPIEMGPFAWKVMDEDIEQENKEQQP